MDCGAARAGDGTRARPLNTLDVPAGAVRLRRGSVCRGTLVARSSVRAYGRGPRPRIEGTGGEAVLVRDLSHVVVRDLELTNRGPEARRAGIRVVAAKAPMVGVTLRRLWIHDVTGDLSKGKGASGGIQLEAVGAPGVRFKRLRVLRNRVERVSRSGISMVGTQDPTRPDADTPWPEASTGVLVARNRVDRVGGDGIVVRGTVGARVRGNVVSRGNLRGSPLFGPTPLCNAGIWAFGANGTVIERNEVFGMESHDCDGTGFDVDYNQDGTVIQANYSHDNEGGFVLLCSDDNPRHRADVRFNLSVDDAATLNTVPCPATEGHVGDLSGLRVFNNTVVAARPRVVGEQFELPVLVGGGSLLVANNLIAATAPDAPAFPCGANCTRNLFAGMPPSGSEPIEGDPRFAAAEARGRGRERVGRGFRLRPGSPGIGAGAAIADPGTVDYFGGPVARTVGFTDRRG